MAKEIAAIKPFFVAGKVLQAGEVTSLSDADAQYLVSIGRAEYVGKELTGEPVDFEQGAKDAAKQKKGKK